MKEVFKLFNLKVIKSSFFNYFFFIIFIFSMGGLYPFAHNYVLFSDLKVLISIFFIVIWIIILVLIKKQIKLPSKNFTLLFIIQCFFFVIVGFTMDSPSNFFRFYYLFLSWITLVLVLNSFQTLFFLRAIIVSCIIMAVFSVIGSILFVLGYLPLFGIYEYQGDYNIYNYGLFFVKRTDELLYQLRPAGYFDEPGSFAYVVMFLLLINRKYLKNFRFEYLLLFLPLVTTSLAHIFTIILFFIFFYLRKNNLGKIFQVIVICIFALFLIANIDNEAIDYFKLRTFDRFENLISGEVDKSRQGGIDLGPIIFKKYWYGYSKENVSENYPDFVNETFWGPLIFFGVFGVWIFYLPLIYILFNLLRNKDINGLLALFIIFINILQRPYYYYPIFMVLLYFLFFKKADVCIDRNFKENSC